MNNKCETCPGGWKGSDEMKTVDVTIRNLSRLHFKCPVCEQYHAYIVAGTEKPETVVCRCGVTLKVK